MLAYLSGTIAQREITGGPAGSVVLEVAGVGFEIVASQRTVLALGNPGDQATVHTALVIRENEWTIFGFADGDEREMFEVLRSVNGVGPRLALALLSTLSPQQLSAAILSDDQKLISQAPGVGAKLAQRLILELKTKAKDWEGRRGLPPGGERKPSAALGEAQAILTGLGYTASEINLALDAVVSQGAGEDDVEFVVQRSLKYLGTAAL